jgi:hypothetical protein
MLSPTAIGAAAPYRAQSPYTGSPSFPSQPGDFDGAGSNAAALSAGLTSAVAATPNGFITIGVGFGRYPTKEEEPMYARIARFEGGDVSQIDAVIDGARQMIDSTFDSPPEGLEGAKAVWMLVDRENARGLGITLFENEEDLRRGDEALNAMSPAVDAGQRRANVEIYEIAHRRERQ